MYHRQKRELAGSWWGQPELIEPIKEGRAFTPIHFGKTAAGAHMVWLGPEFWPEKYGHIQYTFNGVPI